jgi:hypothetical protein
MIYATNTPYRNLTVEPALMQPLSLTELGFVAIMTKL